MRIITAMTMPETRALLRSSPRKRGLRRPASNLRRNGQAQIADECLQPDALYRLMTWLSPAYPVGAFAYSGAIEWAVGAGDITDAETLQHWLETMLTEGTGLNDGIFFAHAYRAVTDDDDVALREAAELAAAFVPTRERHLETTTLGRAFVDVTRAAWPCPALEKLRHLWHDPPAYPVAVGVACAGHSIPLRPALQAFLTAIVSNWVSAGLRLIPLGHTESQRLLNALEPAVAIATQRGFAAKLDDLSSATFRADIASARHETQYTRLFRS
jgi:urease accessory protein